MSKIVITHCPISEKKEDVFAMAKDDERLVAAIKNISDDLSARGVEIFERKDNIIATEDGYYCAFFEDDLTKN